MEEFEALLTGGHPNSLGRTEEVVDLVLRDRGRLDALYRCFFSADPIVRLRTASAMKRVMWAQPDWLVPYIDRLTGEIAAIDQPSVKWTSATLFGGLSQRMTADQRAAALVVMQRNLEREQDWIVQNITMQTLTDWAANDACLGDWLRPRLAARQSDSRRSVANTARKMLARLGSTDPAERPTG
jgi:hypothetical protein